MSRSKAREVAMIMVYSGMLGGAGTAGDILNTLEEGTVLEAEENSFAEELVSGVSAHTAELDALIGRHAVGWTLDRIAKVDLSILRVAVYEMLYRDEVPTGAAINEAVELAKRYGGEKSYSFVNGILGTIARERESANE